MLVGGFKLSHFFLFIKDHFLKNSFWLFRSIHQYKLYWKKGKEVEEFLPLNWMVVAEGIGSGSISNPSFWSDQSLWKWYLCFFFSFFYAFANFGQVFTFLAYLKFWVLIIIWNFLSVIQYKVVGNLIGYCWFSILMTDLCLSWSRSGYMNIFCQSFFCFFRSHSDLLSSLVFWGAYMDFFFNVQLNAHFDLLRSSSLVQLKSLLCR